MAPGVRVDQHDDHGGAQVMAERDEPEDQRAGRKDQRDDGEFGEPRWLDGEPAKLSQFQPGFRAHGLAV
jgi:hypothetical protein